VRLCTIPPLCVSPPSMPAPGDEGLKGPYVPRPHERPGRVGLGSRTAAPGNSGLNAPGANLETRRPRPRCQPSTVGGH